MSVQEAAAPTAEREARAERFLMLSQHDFRTPRWANVHFIAAELAKRGECRFFSHGFSVLSAVKGDPRTPIAASANRIERRDGVECYLWKTPLHPVHLDAPALRPIERLAFAAYRAFPSPVLARWIGEATTIVIESGLSPLFIALCRKANPSARLIYLCSDDLATIGCSPVLIEALRAGEPMLDDIVIPSRALAHSFERGDLLRNVPHGIDPSIARDADPSPYESGLHAVSVGSMLFDRTFFEIAAPAFPAVTFHVIGAGASAQGLSGPNLRVYPEMEYRRTLPFVKHAAFGVAPYSQARFPAYLVDTSMKLMQFAYFGTPAVCPHAAAGGRAGRFGYVQGDRASILAAVENALAAPRLPGGSVLTWAEATDRMLDPAAYADTRV
jgi:2-beta-glucuronyltransferase